MTISKKRSQFTTSTLLLCLGSTGLLASCTLAEPPAAAPVNNVLPAKASKNKKFGDMIGLNVKYSQGEPQADIALLPELGVKWVRDTVLWRIMEPEAGKYVDFPPEFKKRLEFYKAHDIGINFLLVFGNGNAYPDTPENKLNSINAPAFGRYAAQITRMLKAEGIKFQLELWNEPHNFVILKMVGGQWNGKPPSPWVDHYVSMVNEAVEQVKAIDPDVHLMTDEDVWMNHYQFLAKGLHKDLDGFGLHPYWNKNSKGPEDTGIDTNTGWALPYHLTDKDRSLNSAMRRLSEEAVAKMGKAPLLWHTEIGCNVGGETIVTPMTPEGKVTEEAQAAYLLRTMVISAAARNVETVYWFSSYDGPDGAFGLRANDGTHRKSYEAFKVMTSQLGDTTYTSHLIGKDHLTTGLQAHLFSSPKGDKMVLWNIDGEREYLGPKAQAQQIRITDVLGKEVRPLFNEEGRLLLKLTQSPVYVVGLPEKLALEPTTPDELVITPTVAGASLPANAGKNLALNRPVVVSDRNLFGWDKGLTDGSTENNSTHTFATGGNDTFPKTATVDLGKSSLLNMVRLGVPSFGSTKTVQLSLSIDGEKFSEVGSYVFSQSKEETHLFSFKPVSARYIRLTYPDHYNQQVNYPTNYVFTTELEAYASDQNN